MSKFIPKAQFEMVKSEEVAFPSFMPKAQPPTEDLISSIDLNGIYQPIGICKNDGQEFKEYKYLVIWGRRRLLAAHNLGMKEIPAMVIDIKPSKEEFLKYSSMQALTSTPITPVDISNSIRELYFEYGDEKIISEKIGIPLQIIKLAIQEMQVENIEGGREVFDYCYESCSLNKFISKKVLDAVMKPDNISVDIKKGKKLAEVLAVQDFKTQNQILKSAMHNPLGDINQWTEDAETNLKNLEDSFGINLIEEENYGLLKMAEANGLSTNEMIRKILKDKLVKEGFLEEE